MQSKAGVPRSQLFVPANRADFFRKAAASEADGIILDLEDSVAASDLPAARAALGEAVGVLAGQHCVSVRINKPFHLLVADLDVAVAAQPLGLVLPKVESPEEVAIASALVEEREMRNGIERGAIEFQILIESSVGLMRACEIAMSSHRVVSVILGAEDLAAELEVEPGAPHFDLRWAHGQVVMAARAADLVPLGLLGSLTNFEDLESLREDVFRSRAFGYVGAFCIHPAQLAILNAGFTPSAEEVARAKAVLRAMKLAEGEGRAAAGVAGRMVDKPVAKRAESILRRVGEWDEDGGISS